MKKDNNNRRKAAIGAVLAAGVTTGAIAVCASNESKPVQSETPEVELTAADKVLIDGQEIDSTELLNIDDGRHRVRPMYGVRQRPIKLIYGPRPGSGMQVFDEPEDNVLNGVYSDVARIAELDSATSFSRWIPISEEMGFTPEKRKELKEAIEKRFDLEIDDEVFNDFVELWDIVKYVRRFRPDY